MSFESLISVCDVARQYGISHLEIMLNGTWIKADFRIPEAPEPAVTLGKDPSGKLTSIANETDEERDEVMFYSSG